MPAERLLLDTHALLWWQAGSDRLSRRAATAIEGVDQLWISAISLWEIATLVRLGRVALDRPQRRLVADLLARTVGCLLESRLMTGWCRSPSSTRVKEFPRTYVSECLSGSTAGTRRAHERRAEPASGSQSSSTSSPTTVGV